MISEVQVMKPPLSSVRLDPIHVSGKKECGLLEVEEENRRDFVEESGFVMENERTIENGDILTNGVHQDGSGNDQQGDDEIMNSSDLVRDSDEIMESPPSNDNFSENIQNNPLPADIISTNKFAKTHDRSETEEGVQQNNEWEKGELGCFPQTLQNNGDTRNIDVEFTSNPNEPTLENKESPVSSDVHKGKEHEGSRNSDDSDNDLQVDDLDETFEGDEEKSNLEPTPYPEDCEEIPIEEIDENHHLEPSVGTMHENEKSEETETVNKSLNELTSVEEYNINVEERNKDSSLVSSIIEVEEDVSEDSEEEICDISDLASVEDDDVDTDFSDASTDSIERCAKSLARERYLQIVVTVIQSCIRRFICLKKIEHDVKAKSAIIFQNQFRMQKVRLQWERMVQSSIMIQCHVRQSLATRSQKLAMAEKVKYLRYCVLKYYHVLKAPYTTRALFCYNSRDVDQKTLDFCLEEVQSLKRRSARSFLHDEIFDQHLGYINQMFINQMENPTFVDILNSKFKPYVIDLQQNQNIDKDFPLEYWLPVIIKSMFLPDSSASRIIHWSSVLILNFVCPTFQKKS